MAEEEEQRGGCFGWCLKRVGANEERLLLTEGEEVTLGRGVGVTYQLVSAMCPLMISRTHCIFRQNVEGQWTITDNDSLNGVWVNKERLKPQKSHLLTKGCSVQLGVPLQNQDQPEFEYEYVQENLDQIRPLLIRPESGKGKPARNKRKLNCDDSEASGTEGTSNMSKAKLQRVTREGKPVTKSQKVDLTKQPTVKMPSEPQPDCCVDSEMMAATQQHCPNTLQLSKMRQSIAELRSLNVLVQEKQMAVQEKLKRPQESTSRDSKRLQSDQQELHNLQQQLSSRREEHLQTVNDLKKIFQEEQSRKSFPGVSKSAEEQPKEPLAQALQEHALLMEELNQSHEDFEQIIQAKNRELQETKKEKERMEAQREDMIHHMNDVLDNELQCIICSEHFIEAVTLNCAHSFCSFCIHSWRKRKDECPICRQEIKTQTRSLVLDNCINSMVDKLSMEMKDRRMALILERKERQQGVTPTLTPTLTPGSDNDSSSPLSDISPFSYIDDSVELEEDDEDDESSGSDDSDLSLDSDEDDYDFIIHP